MGVKWFESSIILHILITTRNTIIDSIRLETLGVCIRWGADLIDIDKMLKNKIPTWIALVLTTFMVSQPNGSVYFGFSKTPKLQSMNNKTFAWMGLDYL